MSYHFYGILCLIFYTNIIFQKKKWVKFCEWTVFFTHNCTLFFALFLWDKITQTSLYSYIFKLLLLKCINYKKWHLGTFNVWWKKIECIQNGVARRILVLLDSLRSNLQDNNREKDRLELFWERLFDGQVHIATNHYID